MANSNDRTHALGNADESTILPQTARAEVGSAGSNAAPDELQRGATVGRYVVLQRVGQGAMGAVYAGYDPELDRKVALKVLRPDRDHHDLTHLHERLRQEARSLGKLAHPNVVAVHDTGEFAGRLFLAMEFVNAPTLREWLNTAPRTPQAILDVFVQAGRGLAAAHAAGVVHRDFKPDNVMVGQDGRVRVVDFGLAGTSDAPEADAAPRTNAAAQPLDPSLTQRGALLGTPRYMAPEQRQGERATPRSDQYSFCLALQEAMGQALPRSLQPILTRGLNDDASQRFAGMEALLKALTAEHTTRHRRRRVTAIVGLLLVVGTVILSQGLRESPCSGAERHLAGIWDKDLRERLRAAFAATQLPFADAAFAETTRVLDTYASRWVTAHGRVCAATSIHHEQSADMMDLKMQCLERRRNDLKALMDMLVGANAALVERAPSAVVNLAAVEDCERAEMLAAVTPRPTEPAQRAALDRFETQLQQVRAYELAGDSATGLRLAVEVDTASRDLDYAPLRAETLFRAGRASMGVHDFEAAQRYLEAAYAQADAGRVDDVRATVATDLIRLLGVLQQHHDVAQAWASRARAVLQRISASDELKVDLLAYEGDLAESMGNYQTAAAILAEVLKLRERLFGPRDRRVAAAHHNLANALNSLGKNEEAMTHHREAIAILTERVGSEHPDVATTLYGAANVLMEMRVKDEPLKLLEQALRIRARALGANHGLVADCKNSIGAYLDSVGQPTQALTYYHDALRIREAETPRNPDRIAMVLNNIGASYEALGDFAAAARSFEQALALRISVLGPNHPDVALIHFNLGSELAKLHRYREALAAHERALNIYQVALPAEHPYLAESRVAIGDILVELGRYREALARLEPARPYLDPNAAGPRATGDFAMARALWMTGGDRKHALALARAALDGFHADPAAKEQQAAIQAWLAARERTP